MTKNSSSAGSYEGGLKFVPPRKSGTHFDFTSGSAGDATPWLRTIGLPSRSSSRGGARVRSGGSKRAIALGRKTAVIETIVSEEWWGRRARVAGQDPQELKYEECINDEFRGGERLAARVHAPGYWIERARANVHHHYDLDERLYRLFLDEDLQYSCAYFPHEGMSLDEAQLAKKRHIAAKLALRPGQHVLDIGSGWGGLALSLAGWAGVRVTGVTLSGEQQKVASERAARAGLGGDATFLLKDYRELSQRFDRIVSVGMFEHVGIGHYDEFFRTCAGLLAEDGVMLLHSIGRFDGPGATNPWINKYIFPGGYIPALSEVIPAVERAGLIIADIEILRLHYAKTLRAWRERFLARREEAAAIYDERFCRMWEFYLAASELAFRNQDMMVFQMQLVKDQTVLPLTRGYMEEAEGRLALADEEGESLRLAGE